MRYLVFPPSWETYGTCDLVSLAECVHTLPHSLAQGQMYEQKIADAMHEVNKPMARQRDDEDLDRMLREQQRDGDPMAAMLRRKKERTAKVKGQIVPHHFQGNCIYSSLFVQTCRK